jgi:hypothetical protein
MAAASMVENVRRLTSILIPPYPRLVPTIVLFLDKRNRLIADKLQQEGTVDHTRSIRARWSSGRWS